MNFHHLDLVFRTMKSLENRFNRYGHQPSQHQWEALTDLVRCLDQMALGVADKQVFLSSLDPGVGKTSALKAYVDQLLAQPSRPYSEVGVMICLNTLDEVAKMVDDIGIPKEMLGVWTSRKDLNSMGRPDLENARVLILTQHRVLKETAQGLWAADKLHYQGKVRQVRVWDEEFLPGSPISLSVNDVMITLKSVQKVSASLRNNIKKAFDEIETLPDRTPYVVPDYMGDEGVNLNDLLGTIAYQRGRSELVDEVEASLEALARISGKRVVVRRDNPEGNACVDYTDTVPGDIAPVLVLDASGRRGVRVLYEDMHTKRGLITPLKSASKDYSNLTIHIWRKGGGKASWEDPVGSSMMLDGIAATILKKPKEDWLVIHHKHDATRGIPDIASEMKRRLTLSSFKLTKFRNWGAHKATNEFADVANIVLAGTLFYRPSQYEARKRLGAGLTPDSPFPSDDELKDFQVGESANDILQGACRGAIRKSVDGGCPVTNLYIIASPGTGIENALARVFPGAKIVPWLPVKLDLKGNSQSAFKVLMKWKKKHSNGDFIRFKDLATRLNISLRQFTDTVRRDTKFLRSLEAEGFVEHVPNQYAVGYRLASSEAE